MGPPRHRNAVWCRPTARTDADTSPPLIKVFTTTTQNVFFFKYSKYLIIYTAVIHDGAFTALFKVRYCGAVLGA